MHAWRWGLLIVAVPWCLSVLVKVARTRTSPDASYLLASWDGGLVWRGRQLGRAATLRFGLFAVAMLVLSAWLIVAPTRSAHASPASGSTASSGKVSERDARAKCSGGDLEFCVELGLIELNRHAYAAAKTRFQDLCGRGQQRACAWLGSLYGNGLGGEINRRQGIELTTKSCDSGEAYGCYLLGGFFETSMTDVVASNKRAVELYQRACKQEVPESCAELGLMSYSGRSGVTRDLTRASEYLQKACQLGDSTSCTQLQMIR